MPRVTVGEGRLRQLLSMAVSVPSICQNLQPFTGNGWGMGYILLFITHLWS